MIKHLTQEDYRAEAGISKSDLDHIAPPRTPAHYRAHKEGLLPVAETPALRFGSLLHTAVLEPKTLDVVCKPDGFDGRTKEGKAWLAENAERTVVSRDEMTALDEITANVHAHPVAGRLLKEGRAEQSLFAHNGHGQLLKCRPDFMPENCNVLVDLKTTAAADYGSFAKSLFSYRYHVQAAYYLDICKALGLPYTTFVFVAVEKVAPFAVVTYQIDDDAIEAGRAEYQRDLALIRHCEAKNEWPGYPDELLPISLPEWALPHND